jgi:hypothetical protein
MDWCLTGPDDRRRRSGAEAGSSRGSCPADKVEAEALALAAKIASFSLPVVLKIKESINPRVRIVAVRRASCSSAGNFTPRSRSKTRRRDARLRRQAQTRVQAQVNRQERMETEMRPSMRRNSDWMFRWLALAAGRP